MNAAPQIAEIPVTTENVEQINTPSTHQNIQQEAYRNNLRSNNHDIAQRLILDKGETGWENNVNDVLVILSASRSGSSVLFDALSNCPGVIAPAGEHEPWLTLSENKYPFTDSDAMPRISNKDFLLRCIRNDLLKKDNEIAGNELAILLHNRRVIQQMPRVTSHPKDVDSFNVVTPIENPPFIKQPTARRATDEELASETLLFKSPSDAYRPGFYEELFPNARIKYLHLTRGFAQTINGLMDGWLSPDAGYISNAVGLTGKLAIGGYTKHGYEDTYWCFDLFPEWQQYRTARLIEICTQQWLQAHAGIKNKFSTIGTIAFELLFTDSEQFTKEVSAITGLEIDHYDWSKPVMATAQPKAGRWRKRRDLFLNIDQVLPGEVYNQLTEMQHALGYSMEENSWH